MYMHIRHILYIVFSVLREDGLTTEPGLIDFRAAAEAWSPQLQLSNWPPYYIGAGLFGPQNFENISP